MLCFQLTPFFIDRDAHPCLPLSLPDFRNSPEYPPRSLCIMKDLEKGSQGSTQHGAAGPQGDTGPLSGRHGLPCGGPGTASARDQGATRRGGNWEAAATVEGPFLVNALVGPNTYTLALPGHFKCSPTVSVERLKPRYAREDQPAPLDPGGLQSWQGGGVRD
jgi:hypothetical protein